MGDMLAPGNPTEQPLEGFGGPGADGLPPSAPPEGPVTGHPEESDEDKGKDGQLSKEQQAVLTKMRQKDKSELEGLRTRDEERDQRLQRLEWELEERRRAEAAGPAPEPPGYPEGVNEGIFDSAMDAGLARSSKFRELEEKLERANEIARNAVATAAMGHYRVDPERFKHVDKLEPQLQMIIKQNPNLDSRGLDAAYDSFSARFEREENAGLRKEVEVLREEKRVALEKSGATPSGTTPPAQQGPDYSNLDPEEYEKMLAMEIARANQTGQGIS